MDEGFPSRQRHGQTVDAVRIRARIGWKHKGWITAAQKPVIHQDLWKALDEPVERHRTTWSWTKGHASHADHNRRDGNPEP
ncbi:MAG: hypothetical protein LAP40_00965 [Acidobacteriia bacterium]|nr:hypothetical protein [Terriglobia bacterium]